MNSVPMDPYAFYDGLPIEIHRNRRLRFVVFYVAVLLNTSELIQCCVGRPTMVGFPSACKLSHDTLNIQGSALEADSCFYEAGKLITSLRRS